MINAHSHPVLVIFCQLLVNRIMVRKKAKLRRNKSTSTDVASAYSFVEHDNGKESPRYSLYRYMVYVWNDNQSRCKSAFWIYLPFLNPRTKTDETVILI